ncbi:MAG TPA: DUF2779 domain-containing protein [Candidatus Cloacimonadota bacterium]|nr:DUF2779 domain-containing protein [Candidatus Cloacimonadota bacterium]
MKPRYLTKSRFKLALECETKLFYTNKKEYPDTKVDDPFMEALAEGGFQVEELARLYHGGGILIEERDYEKSLAMTNELLKKDKVIIYQAAFRFENLFIRTDILVKNGKKIDLIEVKAKSFDGSDSMDFLNKKGNLDSKWTPYIYDVAFQKYVLINSHPEFDVRAYIMLADKTARTTVDGLNQNFLIIRDKVGFPQIKTRPALTAQELGGEILIKVKVDDIIGRIYDGTDTADPPELMFIDRIRMLSDYYQRDEKIETPLGGKCKKCEFTCDPEDLATGVRSGFQECWKSMAEFADDDFNKPSILDVWDFRKKDQVIGDGKYFMKDLDDSDIGHTAPKKSGMSRTERQFIQIQKAIEGDNTMDLRIDELRREMESWRYPLHMIDFETTAVAIPFHRNMRPYDGIAFQFSHHIIDSQGNIKHAGQYLNVERGRFPNFEFVRALKKELDQDEGTIFRYAAHENTYLNIIYTQLREVSATEVPDKDELCNWIRTITNSTDRQADEWEGSRTMVDLLEMVKRFYYDPYAGGSNSIKAILPAVLNRSEYLQEKYSKPIYGTASMPSYNFQNKAWIEIHDGIVTNPYKLLPPLFEGKTDEQLEEYITDPMLAEGGAAMMAYAKMQFSEMSEEERKSVVEGLLRYCELDTFAMVLIWEFWNNELAD